MTAGLGVALPAPDGPATAAPRRPVARVLSEPARTPGALRYALAAVLLLTLGMRQVVALGVTTGVMLAVALAPVWLPSLSRYRGARTVVFSAALALVSGLWLTEVSAFERPTSLANLVGTTALVAGIVCTVGVLLWARTVMSVRHAGVWFALGMLVFEAGASGRLSVNPWKFAFAIPVAVAVLALVSRPRGTVPQVLALLGLAGVSALQDSRSYFATFLLAALLVAWQMRPALGSRRGSAAATILMVGGIGAAVYQLGSSLLLQGFLGREAQERSLEQIDTAGSLLLGGRPELTATAALMRDTPWGFGSGAVPSPTDVLVAKEGMAAIGYRPNNGYVENYMFGGQFKLHSVVGDTWAYFGFAGLLLTAVIAVLVVGNLARLLAARRASGLVVFLSCFTVWNLLFSPLYGSAATLGLALGMGLLTRPTGLRDRVDRWEPTTPGRGISVPPAPAAPRS